MLLHLFTPLCNTYQNLFPSTDTLVVHGRPISTSTMDVWLDLGFWCSQLVLSIPSSSCCSFDICPLVCSSPASRTLKVKLAMPLHLKSSEFNQRTFNLLMRHLSHFNVSVRFPDVSVSAVLDLYIRRFSTLDLSVLNDPGVNGGVSLL
jgi:hypothetical protein